MPVTGKPPIQTEPSGTGKEITDGLGVHHSSFGIMLLVFWRATVARMVTKGAYGQDLGPCCRHGCSLTMLYVMSSAGADGARSDAQAQLARSVTGVLGGRYSTELGIDVDAGDAEVGRWFLVATLFGARISAQVAEHTFGGLTRRAWRRSPRRGTPRGTTSSPGWTKAATPAMTSVRRPPSVPVLSFLIAT